MLPNPAIWPWTRFHGDNTGHPRQLKSIKKYSGEHEIKIVQIFREEGVSGTKESMDRPA
jgi:DNA invertase Pin-like site-specific DNA recombinase